MLAFSTERVLEAGDEGAVLVDGGGGDEGEEGRGVLGEEGGSFGKVSVIFWILKDSRIRTWLKQPPSWY